jgi:hypothetical protein
MIGTTARILIGLIVGAAMLIAVTVALCTDLIAPETRPALRRARLTRKRPAIRSLMEART